MKPTKQHILMILEWVGAALIASAAFLFEPILGLAVAGIAMIVLAKAQAD